MWTAGSAGRSHLEVAGVVCSRAVLGKPPPLAPLRVRRSVRARWEQKEKARAGEPPRRATAGCSFATRRGSPARDTLEPGRGAMQGSSAARTTRMGDVRWHATAPTRARPRAGRRSLAGTALRATPPSACCPIVWRRACPAPSMSSKRWWRTPSRPRAWPPRAMRCAAMRSSSRGRCAGSSAGYVWSITSLASSSGCSPTSSCGASPRWGRCVLGFRPKPRSGRFAPSSPSNSPCCPHRWGSNPTVSARGIAFERANTRWGLTRRRRLRNVPRPGPSAPCDEDRAP